MVFGFGIVVGLACLYPLIFGAPFFLTKRDFNDPGMWKTPVRLPDLSIATALGMRLSYFGWEFEVPWKDLDPNETKVIGKPPWQWQVISFRSGRRIVFMRGPANVWLKVLFPPSGSFPRNAYNRWLLGADTWSDYAFTRAMLEVTPDQLTPFTFRREGARLTWLLMFKFAEVAGHNANSDIFMIDAPDFRGFQYGKPGSGQSQIDDRLYSDKGGVEFRFSSRPPNTAPISQADINRVIQTVKPPDDWLERPAN